MKYDILLSGYYCTVPLLYNPLNPALSQPTRGFCHSRMWSGSIRIYALMFFRFEGEIF